MEPTTKAPRLHKVTTGMLIAIFLFGIAFGYILGLWHQIAQKQHRENCAACQMYGAED